MKTLNFYVTKSFLATFMMSIGVLTFGMLGARLIKVFEYMSKGVPFDVAMTFMLYVTPIALSYTIPWAALASIMLVFGRMSADNEITAMRACGISVLQIISPIIIFTFVLTLVCLFLNVELGPRYLGEADDLIKEVGVKQPMALLEPGRPIEFENNHIYIQERIGENELRDIQVFRMDEEAKQVEQDITAAKGKIEVDNQGQVLNVILYNATVVVYDKDSQNPRRTFSKQMTFVIDYGENFNKVKIGKRIKYLSFKEIFARIIMDKKLGIDTTRLEVELNQRLALALSPIAFLILGMPLAIRTSRRETSIGLFLSVLLAGLYTSAITICESLYSKPGLYPQFMLWAPNILYQIFGSVFLFRIARR
ncbi:MAG: hypothetical protein A2X49_11210 [Lentisphaerae bacterium GWF2_52_8]|nr:MAG: hypothetical protein A2X49_11210 [Lentisphaerae bacterium GWF2_52_8]